MLFTCLEKGPNWSYDVDLKQTSSTKAREVFVDVSA